MKTRDEQLPEGSDVSPPQPSREPKRKRLATLGLWMLQGLVAALFLAAGGAKLAGVPMMVDVFERVGMGQWFRTFTGAIEVAGAIMLVVPILAGLGALLLATTMFFAILAHLLLIGGDPAPATVLLLATVIVAWARRQSTLAQVRRVITGRGARDATAQRS